MVELGSPDAKFVDLAKRRIRSRMRAVRGAIPGAALGERSRRIVASLRAHPVITSARALALFWPMLQKREVDLRELDAWARERGKALYYPFMDPVEGGYRTGFRRVDSPEQLVDRGRGFSEPPLHLPAATAGEVDAVVVPALAVSEDGHRLGYGAGFYDSALPDVCPPAQAITVAFAFQLLVEVPHAEHDFRSNWVLTDEHAIQVKA